MTDNTIAHRRLSRRAFAQGLAATGLAATGSLGAFQALAEASTRPQRPGRASSVSFSVSDWPLETDKAALAEANTQLAAYEKLHPTTHITPNSVKFNPATFYTQFAAGNYPNVYKAYFTDAQEIIRRHYSADITSSLRNWEWLGSITPGVRQTASDASGRLYGIPLDAYSLGLCYSRKAFQEAGLDTNKPPTTWEQFRAYSKKLTTATRKGFGMLSTQNTGGWHFTAILYSEGGRGEALQAGHNVATFNSPAGVKVAQLLHDMRWSDNSVLNKPMGYDDNTRALAEGQIAMGILAGDQIAHFKQTYKVGLDDFMMAGLPQGPGNATLFGGNVFFFDPRLSSDTLAAAIDWIKFQNFNLAYYDSFDRALAASGGIVGIPNNIAYTGALLAARQKVDATYLNAPLKNYSAYLAANARLKLVPEARVQAQTMYQTLDPVVQAMLTDQSASPQHVLDAAARQFQRVLDQSAS